MMTNHLARVADLEFVGKDKIRKEAEEAVDEAISIFEQVFYCLFSNFEKVIDSVICRMPFEWLQTQFAARFQQSIIATDKTLY